MSLLYKLIGKRVIREYIKEQNKPIGFNDLEFAFIQDVDGKPMRFYRWPERLDLPVSRADELREIVSLMMMGLTKKNITDLIDVAEDNKIAALENSANKKKFHDHMAKLGACLLEIKNRHEKIVPMELIYNLLAVCYVREDEVPQKFDKEIQRQKAKLFEEQCELNSSFFFQLPELKSQLSWLNISKSDWKNFIRQSKAHQAFLNHALSFTLSASGSSKPEKVEKI